MNIQEAINAIRKKKTAKALLSKQVDELKDQLDVMQDELISMMQNQGLNTVNTGDVSVIITKRNSPSITDWDKALQHIIENGHTHLLMRKINSAAYQEVLNLGESVPGVESFTKSTLSITKT